MVKKRAYCVVHCSTDKRRFRIVEDHIADLHVLIDAQTLRNATRNPHFFRAFIVFCPWKTMSLWLNTITCGGSGTGPQLRHWTLEFGTGRSWRTGWFSSADEGERVAGTIFLGQLPRDESGASGCSYPFWKGQGNGSKMQKVFKEI